MIDKFIAGVKGGMARTNRYSVMFPMPKCMTSGYAEPPADLDMQKVHLFCDTASLPGINYSTTQSRTFGEFREMPYEKLYDAVTLSFYVDKNMMVKSFFDSWANGIQDKRSRTFNYYNEYIVDMDIEVYDVANESIYLLSLYEAYPKTIGAIALDNASKDVMKLSVTMQYKYYRTYKLGFNDGEQETAKPAFLSSLPPFLSQGSITNALKFPI